MRRIATAASAATLAGFLLGGCATYGDEADQRIVVAADYQALADCYWEREANPRGFNKVELPSAKTSRITAGSDTFTTLRIDFVGLEDGRTEVRGFTSGMAAGAAYWRGQVLPALEACGAPA